MRLIFIFSLLLACQIAQAQCSFQILNCPAGQDTLCDESNNNVLFWNNALLWDEVHQTHNLADRVTDLNFIFTDSCGTSNLTYELLLDLNNDGIQETLLRPDLLLSEGRILIGNTNGNPGDTIQFDNRQVPPGAKYDFALEQSTLGDTIQAKLGWNTADNPGDYAGVQLPLGQHLIRWIITNGVDSDTCTYEFKIQDCEQPTLVCANDFNINLILTGMISIWDSDILQSKTDNLCPDNLIQTAIKKADGGMEFPLDSMGNPQKNIVFTCEDLGPQPVQLWAMDASGNTSFCELILTVQDFVFNCPDTTILYVCAPHFCNTDMMTEELYYEFVVMNPAFPPGGIIHENPCTEGIPLSTIPVGSNPEVRLIKDDNHLNGVSTYDLVLISRHILGIESLDSPYKIIAADANGSQSVTTFDILELRKLILGIYSELPNNTSWRFIPEAYSFPNPFNPFMDTFPETAFIQDLLIDPDPSQFLSIKVGDVNCSAIANSLVPVSDDRQSLSLYSHNVQTKPNTLYEVPVFAEGSLLGLQAALQIDPTLGELVEVLPGAYPGMSAEVFAQRGGEEVRMSWFHHEPVVLSEKAPLFTLRIRAKSDASLDQVLQINPSDLRAEAYTDREEQFDLQLLFQEDAQNGMEFFAPYPNPGVGSAFFPVETQDGGPCTLSVYDARGQLVFSQKNSLAPGLNQLEIPAEVFAGSGVFIWKMECGEVPKSGKFIRY
ncbi:MAG: T9SS type A sorting domain-containing protein [Saprospiraceae bacterium]